MNQWPVDSEVHVTAHFICINDIVVRPFEFYEVEKVKCSVVRVFARLMQCYAGSADSEQQEQ